MHTLSCDVVVSHLITHHTFQFKLWSTKINQNSEQSLKSAQAQSGTEFLAIKIQGEVQVSTTYHDGGGHFKIS